MDIVLTITEAFQLAGLITCIFVTLYLIFSTKNSSLSVVPALYFAALTAHFFLPLSDYVMNIRGTPYEAPIMLAKFIIPELSFLLIIQFLTGRIPNIFYWLILCLPLIGGAPFLYMSYAHEEVCFTEYVCVSSKDTLLLFRIFGSALLFMLTMLVLQRTPALHKKDVNRRHKYWLVVTLIIFNIITLALDLTHLMDAMQAPNYNFIGTMIAITFIYLVLSSIFRVFGEYEVIKPAYQGNYERDKVLANRIKEMLEVDQIYMQIDYSRASMADQLRLTEQHVSRIINQFFEMSFTELMNNHRLRDAKGMLKDSTESITNIAFKVGFNSITSFNRVFKNSTGQSPREYRKVHKV